MSRSYGSDYRGGGYGGRGGGGGGGGGWYSGRGGRGGCGRGGFGHGVRRMGYWFCPVASCGYDNYSWRTECNMCQAPCPSSGGGGSSLRLSGGPGGSYNSGRGDYGSGGGGCFQRDGGDYKQDETGAQSNAMAGESSIGEVSVLKDISDQPNSSPVESLNGWNRSDMLEWVEVVESSNDVYALPPLDIVLFPDLLGRVWDWARLVPYSPSEVKWSEYKIYLELYLKNNAPKVAALSGKEQPESNKDGISAEFLDATAKQCLEIEKNLLRICLHDLTPEHFILSKLIMMRISQMIGSKGVSFAKVAALMCIMKEAKLMCLSRECEYEIEEIITISSKVRSSALNLMLYEGNESNVVAATAAMVGLIVEAEGLFDDLIQKSPETYVKYLTARRIRDHTATVLTKLDNELACGIPQIAVRDPPSNMSEKLKGVNAENSGKDTNKVERKLAKKLKKQRVTTVGMNSENINQQKRNNQTGKKIGKVEAEGEKEVPEEQRKSKKKSSKRMCNMNGDKTKVQG